MLLFGLSNGYFGSLCMMYGPRYARLLAISVLLVLSRLGMQHCGPCRRRGCEHDHGNRLCDVCALMYTDRTCGAGALPDAWYLCWKHAVLCPQGRSVSLQSLLMMSLMIRGISQRQNTRKHMSTPPHTPARTQPAWRPRRWRREQVSIGCVGGSFAVRMWRPGTCCVCQYSSTFCSIFLIFLQTPRICSIPTRQPRLRPSRIHSYLRFVLWCCLNEDHA